MARRVHTNMTAGVAAGILPSWSSSFRSTTYDDTYGEIYNSYNGVSVYRVMDTSILETAFHSSAADCTVMKTLAGREWIARSAVQGIVDHLSGHYADSTVPAAYAPDAPLTVGALNSASGTVTVSWTMAATHAAGGDAPTGFLIYSSEDGRGFGNPVAVSGGATRSRVLTGLTEGATLFFRVCATNAGGQSANSPVAGVRVTSAGAPADVLVVDGFTRSDSFLAPTRYVPNGLVYGNMTLVRPRMINHCDYVKEHGLALAAAAQTFDSVAAADALSLLSNYSKVVWILGEESTADETFSSSEQTAVTSYLNDGGRMFVSGAEIGWDLDAYGSSSDKLFFTNVLRTAYVSDSGGTRFVTGTASGFLNGVSIAFNYTNLLNDIYAANYPDVLSAGGGATVAAVYGPSAAGTSGAVIQYSNATYRTVVMGFPFETITNATTRATVMSRAMDFLDAGTTSPAPVTILADDFEDGDLAGWTQDTAGNWTNSGSSPVAGARSLRHNLSDVAVTNFIYAQPVYSLSADTTTWRFKLQNGNWDPSGANHFHVYLMASDAGLTGGTADGYAVGVNLSGTDDLLKLWRVTDGAADAVVLASALNWNASMANAIEVTRTPAGLWELKTSTNGIFSGMTSAGTATDTTYTDTSCFGLVFGCTSSRAGQLWLDDVLIHQGDVSVVTDTDGDGVDDYSETIAGTSITDPGDVLAVDSMSANTNTAVLVLRWPSVTGRVYSIWAATNAAGTYTQHIGGLSATAPTNVFTNSLPAGAGQTYYGIRVGLAP